MELFLSWSKSESKELAQIFRGWIPLVLQSCHPFMSQQDIELGKDWNTEINNHLKSSAVGILFVTPENINSPWLNFEAGALSKSLENNQKIIPILFAEETREIVLSESPLKQFQSVITPDEEGIKKLIKTLNGCLESSMEESMLNKVFDMWWPELKAMLKEVGDKAQKDVTNIQESNNDEILLSLVEKVNQLTNQDRRSGRIPRQAIADLSDAQNLLLSANFVDELSEDSLDEYKKIVRTFNRPVEYLKSRM